VERALRLHSRHWIIHHKIVVPVIEQSNRLETICSQILEPLGQSGDSLAHVLLHSDETMTVRSINQLELLAEEARRDPEVQLVLERDADAGQTLLALEGSEQGRDWRVALDSYLHDFGYRCTGFDLSFATWVEDQSFVFQIIRGLLSAAPAEGVAVHSQGQARERALTDERDALIEQVREAAVGKPELLNEFNTAYALAQRLWPLKEDHSHYIDQGSMAMVRIVLAEVGRRLEANGAIEHSNDVWYLDLDEAKTALIAEVPQGLKELVAERGADRERFSKLTPPKHLGTFPPDHDSVEEEVEPVESRGTLRGTAASKGEVTGIARVVMSPDDFHKVRQGDVLVCRSAAPMWTPLFRVISALVSESGGVLSHPAVVAREFNLPAVVGVRFATSRITDGQPVTVSGTDGLVHAG
jgi:phosphohistidine swiveling domain-containing protein